SDHAHLYRRLVALVAQLRAKLGQRADLFAFDTDNHVTSFQACFFGGCARANFANEKARIGGGGKKKAELAREVFGVDTEDRSARVHDIRHIRKLHIEIRHGERIRFAKVAHLSLHFLYEVRGAIAQLDGDILSRAAA